MGLFVNIRCGESLSRSLANVQLMLNTGSDGRRKGAEERRISTNKTASTAPYHKPRVSLLRSASMPDVSADRSNPGDSTNQPGSLPALYLNVQLVHDDIFIFVIVDVICS
jgi:hypothetical protein